jgi:hypothetical protein
VAGWIAIGDCEKVRAKSLAKRGIAPHEIGKSLTDQGARRIGVIEARRHAKDDRVFESFVIQNIRHQKNGKLRLTPNRFFRLHANARKQRVIAIKADDTCDLAIRHDLLLADGPPSYHKSGRRNIGRRNCGASLKATEEKDQS